MQKKNFHTNCIALLSAFLFSLAFIFITSGGFLVLPALFLLALLFIEQLIHSWYSAAGAGFLWGFLVFGIHFSWLLKLLLTKSYAHTLVACGLYGLVVMYLSFTSTLWFIITFIFCFRQNFLIRTFFFILTTSSYFIFLNHYSFWFLGMREGYPFLSPCVPLASYSWFLRGLSAKHTCFKNSNCQTLPEITFIKPTRYKDNEAKAAYDIFHTFAQCVKQSTIYVGPESTYPYPLNKSQEAIKLWHHFLPTGRNFLLGTHHEEGDKIYQAIYWLKSGRIKNFYVKKYTVPFVERMPKRFSNYNLLKNIFIQKTKEFSVGTENKVFAISPIFKIIPLVCSEFFFKTHATEIDVIKRKYTNCQLMIFLFINDSWFIDYFKKIMENVTYLRAVEFGLPILLITHTGCKEIIPSLVRKES